jgi:CheY-like chemotaxis protein
MIKPDELRRPGAPHFLKPILIIDDDDDLRESLVEHIANEGFTIEAVSSGREALDKLRWGFRPCVILLDLQMQGMTGWDFRAEQKRDHELSTIPVVAMTGGYSKWREVDDFAACLRKPVDPVNLCRQLKRFCLGGESCAADDEQSTSPA